MSRRKLRLTILILLSAGMIFLFLLGYLNQAIFQLKKDKLASETGQAGSDAFFAIPYNYSDLQLFSQEIFQDSSNLPDKQELQIRLRRIFKDYALCGDSIKATLERKGIPVIVKWSITISRFEARMRDNVLPLVYARDNSADEIQLFGDEDIGPKARKYLFYKMDINYYCQVDLYMDIVNSFAILRSEMLGIFFIDAILMLLFGGALAYTIRTLYQQKRLADLQSDFINGVTHEFNTPLSSIQLAGQALLKLDDNQVIDKRAEIASLILRQQNHLKKMVDQVLTAAASENPFVSLDFDWFPAPGQLMKMVEEWHQSHPDIHMENQLTITERLWIKIDPSLLTIVIHNILDNAVKYNQSSKPQITVNEVVRGDLYTFAIADNGIGIPADELSRVFKKFYRGHSTGQVKAKGLGLGLYLVRLIIELHHGKVSIVSEVGHGTKISIVLPCKHERVI
jgi:two-component system, OmpR family, phosphate regulon sensor histidine kinase PhoR